MTNAGNLLTTKEVAQLLRVHPKQVYRLLGRGLPALRVGDEWRFDRGQVLAWAGATSGGLGPSPTEGPPPLLAANGDCAVEVLLSALRSSGGALIGLVQADHASAVELLATGHVLVAGQHGGSDGDATAALPKCGRLHLVTREVGLAFRSRSRLRSASGVVGKRIASRPPSAGVRRGLDRALTAAGIEFGPAYRQATEHASHRDVVLSVLAGRADLGLTTQAWARAAQLSFLPLASETYELAIPVVHLGDARAVALCEAAQGREVRRRLRDEFGYDVKHTGELRIGSGE
jgi:excisionase family DNA binding protein